MNAIVRKKDIDSVLAFPLTPVRVILAQKLLERSLTEAERNKLVSCVRKALPPGSMDAFDEEEEKIVDALENGSLNGETPDFSTSERQLLWASYLTHAVSEGVPLHKLPLWRQLADCDHARHELRRHAAYIARDQFNPGTRLVWGGPGSMFFYNLKKNFINIDFVMSMIGGFEDTRSIVFHEIGHSKLTRGFSDKMQEIREEMIALQEKKVLKPTEYARLHGLNVRWNYLFLLWDEAENSPVNRYSINVGAKIQQDMGASLNSVEVVVANAANHNLPVQQDSKTMFFNFKLAVRLSLYKNNGLFTDDAAGWGRMGVQRDWIKAVPPVTGQSNPLADFYELMDLCGGLKGLEQLQPGTLDRMKGVSWLEAITEQRAAQRNAIIDDIWERYALPMIQPLVDEAENQAQQQIQQAIQQKQQQQQTSSGQSQPNAGGDSGGQQQSGASGEGEQSSGEGSGQGQSGQQPSQGSASGSQADGSGGAGSDQPDKPQSGSRSGSAGGEIGEDKSAQPQAGGDGAEKEDADGAGSGGDKAKEDKSDQPEAKGQGAAQEGADDDKSNIEVGEAGKMPRVKIPPKTPGEAAEEARAKAAQGQKGQSGEEGDDADGNGGGEGGEGSSADGDEGQDIGSLLQQMDNEDQAAASAERSNGSEAGKPGESSPSESSSRSSKGGVSRARGGSVRIGDWSNYQNTATVFTPEILQGRRIVRQIQDRQTQILMRSTNKYELEPEGGDMELFEMDRHTDMMTGIAAGRRITEEDAKRFRIVRETRKPAVVDFVIQIDGSASMFWKSQGWKYSPMEAGMNTACIMAEVTRNDDKAGKRDPDRAPINTWIYLWGNNPPLLVARPGEDRVKIGQKIAGLIESNGWGTSLAPVVAQSIKELSEETPETEFAGSIHNLVVSDGDIADNFPGYAVIDTLLSNTKNVTYDVLIINPRGEETEMARVFRALQEKYGEGRVKIVPCSSPDQAHASVLLLLRERMLATKALEVMPAKQRQNSLKRAYDAMLTLR